MTFQEALDYIWGKVNFETTPPETRTPYDLGRMRALMARLGNPQERLSVVHVAGTKGKGSISAMIESVLRTQGLQTGLYSSPHLHSARERLQLRGEPISEEAFVGLVERLHREFEQSGDITTFEALTAMAYVWFAESHLDIVVIEVGLGGRLDATNLVTPLVSVISPLAMEHVPVLGNTIQEITAEKAGIIKEGVPVVTSEQVPEALELLRQTAAKRNAALIVAPEEWKARLIDMSLTRGQRFEVQRRADGVSYTDIPLSLLGKHQIANATVAIATLHQLREQGVEWNEAALRRGLGEVKWPARVEILQEQPMVIVDGAHTEGSAAALVSTIFSIEPQSWEHCVLVLGMSRGKDLYGLMRALEPLTENLILTSASHPRAEDAYELGNHPAIRKRVSAPRVIPRVAEAMRVALAEAGKGGLVVVAGSLFVAAEAREEVLREIRR